MHRNVRNFISHIILQALLGIVSLLASGAIAASAPEALPSRKIPSLSLRFEGGFPVGTTIQTPTGLKPIEQLSIGDTVLSCDAAHNACVHRRIDLTFSYFSDDLVKLTTEASNEEIIVQADHLFYDADLATWVKAKNLSEESRLFDADFSAIKITAIEKISSKTRLYNFSVEEEHNFYVSSQRLLVHNFNPLNWLSEQLVQNYLAKGVILSGIASFVSLMFVNAPYGRHIREGWGPTIANKLGWVLMEVPSVVAFASIFMLGKNSEQAAPRALAALWLTHYCYRTFIYPFLTRTNTKRMPLSLAATGALYNMVNSYINARSLSEFSQYSNEWLKDPRFIVGAAIFALGFATNVYSDHILINLRKPGETSYKIPRGGLFKYVSCPNYFGEIVEWVGWSMATWSLPGGAFALYTAANLVPRALANHAWYKETFKEEYPAERKAIVPKIL